SDSVNRSFEYLAGFQHFYRTLDQRVFDQNLRHDRVRSRQLKRRVRNQKFGRSAKLRHLDEIVTDPGEPCDDGANEHRADDLRPLLTNLAKKNPKTDPVTPRLRGDRSILHADENRTLSVRRIEHK